MLAAITPRFKSMLPRLSLLLFITLVLSGWLQAMAKAEYVQVNWESLDLSSQQRNHLNSLDQTWKSLVTELVPRIQANEKKLKNMMNCTSPDEDEIMRVQQSIHEDKLKLKMQATQIFLDKRKVLTKEQQEKLRKIMSMH